MSFLKIIIFVSFASYGQVYAADKKHDEVKFTGAENAVPVKAKQLSKLLTAKTVLVQDMLNDLGDPVVIADFRPMGLSFAYKGAGKVLYIFKIVPKEKLDVEAEYIRKWIDTHEIGAIYICLDPDAQGETLELWKRKTNVAKKK